MRECTVNLVKAAMDQLVKEKRSVIIEAICQQLDPQRKGVKKAGILGSAEAYAYYQQLARLQFELLEQLQY